MLGQRRRRWRNIEPTMAQCLVFAGYIADSLGDAAGAVTMR